MIAHCYNCGEPGARVQDGRLECEKCTSRFEEYERNVAARDAGLLEWNTSLHDPFWRGWLNSWELFAVIQDTAPRIGNRIHSIAGGDVFECLRDKYRCWLQVWVADTEVIVAHPTACELHGFPDRDEEGVHEFEEWIGHLRHSPALGPGWTRGRCSYGASIANGLPPVVKWSQSGDWASAARTWFIGEERTVAPWP